MTKLATLDATTPTISNLNLNTRLLERVHHAQSASNKLSVLYKLTPTRDTLSI